MLSPGIHPEHWKRATGQMGKMQVVGTDIPLIPNRLLKSGARVRLVDRSGSMVTIEVQWIPFSGSLRHRLS